MAHALGIVLIGELTWFSGSWDMEFSIFQSRKVFESFALTSHFTVGETETQGEEVHWLWLPKE